MFARVTLLEIDTMRIDMRSAVQMFERDVLPTLREQPGYTGVLVLTTAEGSAALVSLWDCEDSAVADGASGFYPETLGRFTTIFRSPPGRERYEVALSELPINLLDVSGAEHA
jgi:hypothetical protein